MMQTVRSQSTENFIDTISQAPLPMPLLACTPCFRPPTPPPSEKNWSEEDGPDIYNT